MVLFFIILNLCSIHSEVHPLKMSVCEITYNADQGEYELDFRIFLDDFSEAMENELTQSNTSFSHTAMKPSIVMIGRYVRSHFNLVINGESQTIRTKSVDLEGIAIHLVLKTKKAIAPTSVHNMLIENSILVDDFPNQRNIVHLFWPGEKKKTVMFGDFKRKEVISIR